MSMLKIAVDADNELSGAFTQIERKNLPFAIMQACNATAFDIRETWKRAAPRVFDRPTPMTINAAMYRKATKQRLYAEIFIRDEAHKGTPPAKYLLPEVEGGQRRLKGMERLLMSKQIMPQGTFAIPGAGADLDQYGNVKSGQVRQIISQMRAGLEAGYTSNETDTLRERRLKRQNKRGGGGRYFALQKQRGKLQPGIYERITSAFGSAARSIFIFSKSVHYEPRYDIFGLAQRQWDKLMPFHFRRELGKAVETSKYRGRT